MEKFEKLKKFISSYKSVVVAFSGGVDSTFLAWACKEVLGKNVLLVTARSSTYPEAELACATKNAKALGLEQRIIVSEEIDIPGFSDNPPDRCYYCKKELFLKITDIAKKENYDVVFDGSNFDDLKDYRPGRKAIEELSVLSPMCDVMLTKDEIRHLSKLAGLETATKPSFACLASRFPYGEHISKEKLDRVGKAEKYLFEKGFTQFRVRSHGDVARIEFVNAEIGKGWEMRATINEEFCKIGYIYVAIDLKGYRTGAMNEVLKIHE